MEDCFRQVIDMQPECPGTYVTLYRLFYKDKKLRVGVGIDLLGHEIGCRASFQVLASLRALRDGRLRAPMWLAR